MNPVEVMSITTIIGMALGFFLQKAPGFRTKLIPTVMFALSAIYNIVSTALPEAIPPSVGQVLIEDFIIGADNVPQMAYIFGFSWGWLLVVAKTIIDAAIPVGVYSGVKNTKQLAVGE